jgi:hypothetical protein
MEFLWAFLLIVGFWGLTSFLRTILGALVPAIYMALGFILGIGPIILGIGGLIGNLINLIFARQYIRREGAMSQAPAQSGRTSLAFIVVFVLTKIINEIYPIEMSDVNFWYIILFVIVASSLIKAYNKVNEESRVATLAEFYDNILEFKVVEKYDDDPKWATYLYFKDGSESWSQTIPGSFRAKHPDDDLTFVFSTKEEAVQYAKSAFKNAEYIDS